MPCIAFRGKSITDVPEAGISTGDWVYGNYLKTTHPTPFIILENETKILVDPETVGQMIRGATTDNGCAIFEHDILKCRSKHQGEIQNRVVDISDMCSPMPFAARFPIEGKTYPDFFSSFELIGNIHDNPELVPARNAA